MHTLKIIKERYVTVSLLILAIMMGSTTGFAVLHTKTAEDRATKISEAQTLLHLTNTFVSVYSQHIQSTLQANFPVPASFRAEAARQFNNHENSTDQPIALMVGLSGREISTPPVDQALAERLGNMISNGKYEQYSTEFKTDKESFLRTVFPTIANQDSCVDCHNRLQPEGPTWVKGDLMGAYVVDRPIGKARKTILQYSVLVGALTGIVSLLGGALFAYSRRLKSQSTTLRVLADTDPLTGCLNRRALNEVFERNSLDQARGAIFVLDLDFFKSINDSYGHDIGDRVLVHFVRLLRTQLRGTDILARIGGEEFAIILTDTDSVNAHKVALRTCEAINNSEFKYEDVVIKYTVSIGAVKIPEVNPQNLETLLCLADKNLYRAKELGRNQVFPSGF